MSGGSPSASPNAEKGKWYFQHREVASVARSLDLGAEKPCLFIYDFWDFDTNYSFLGNSIWLKHRTQIGEKKELIDGWQFNSVQPTGKIYNEVSTTDLKVARELLPKPLKDAVAVELADLDADCDADSEAQHDLSLLALTPVTSFEFTRTVYTNPDRPGIKLYADVAESRGRHHYAVACLFVDSKIEIDQCQSLLELAGIQSADSKVVHFISGLHPALLTKLPDRKTPPHRFYRVQLVLNTDDAVVKKLQQSNANRAAAAPRLALVSSQ